MRTKFKDLSETEKFIAANRVAAQIQDGDGEIEPLSSALWFIRPLAVPFVLLALVIILVIVW